VAHDHRPPGGRRDDGRSRRAAIQHSNLAEEIAGVQRGPGLAVHLDGRLSLKEDVEAVRSAALLDQGVVRLQLHVIGAAGQELELLAGATREQGHAGQSVNFRVAHARERYPRQGGQ
jgi:hypothetical protein